MFIRTANGVRRFTEVIIEIPLGVVQPVQRLVADRQIKKERRIRDACVRF